MPPQPPRRGGRGGRVGEGGLGRSELGKTERALRRAGGRRGEGGGRMEQVEILRRFIQRVQAMKSPDHNGEDNFARDFMVSVRPPRRRPRVSVAGLPSCPRLFPRVGPAGAAPALCVRGARPAASAVGELAGGEVATAPPWPRFSAAREPRERPSGPARSGPAARDSLLSPRPGGGSGVRARLPTPAVPACPSGEGRGEPSGRGRRSREQELGRCWRSLAESLCCCRPGSEGTVGRRRHLVHGDYHRLPKGCPYGISCST